MNDFLDFLAYFGGLVVGLLLFLGVLFFMGCLLVLATSHLLFGESMRDVLNRRFPLPPLEEEEKDEYS